MTAICMVKDDEYWSCHVQLNTTLELWGPNDRPSQQKNRSKRHANITVAKAYMHKQAAKKQDKEGFTPQIFDENEDTITIKRPKVKSRATPKAKGTVKRPAKASGRDVRSKRKAQRTTPTVGGAKRTASKRQR
eukprot:TRINITY_DN50677_c1_g1_i1.p1 TRINITY_DN50677_c1_g1~~TRINITY_DN50677_c1_g1_i1.p1  ORF type:complete len:133 (+),score=33.72 TRINITY_DN50677_c1_g1_i1:161-559(+)